MVLETKRLILREMTLHDVDDLLEVFSDPEVMQFYPQPFDHQMTQMWIERNIQRYTQHGFGLWALILKLNQLGLDKLISLINPANTASRRVAEKNGMTLLKEIEWQNKPTCIYAVERSNSAA